MKIRMADPDKEIKDLFLSKEDFGDGYQDKLFEQYKLFLQMIDSLIQRRTVANNFYLSINTGLLAALGFFFSLEISDSQFNSFWFAIASGGGILFAYSWLRTIESYKQLSSGKWRIIIEIERILPVRLHSTEWKILGEGKDHKKYKPLTDVEQNVPIIFMVIYAIFIILSILLVTGVIEVTIPIPEPQSKS